MSEQGDGRLFPEPAEAAAELGTTYDTDPDKLVELPKPKKDIDFSDAEIDLIPE